MANRAGSIEWVRTPHQDRSRRTLERLLDAAETLLQERGFDNVSVAEIAHAAESSVGAFYARFRDKNGLLNHLHERFSEEALATAESSLAPERWAEASAYEIVAAVTAFLVELHRTRSGLFRAFLLHGCTDPQFQARETRVMEAVHGRLVALLLQRRAEIGHPHPEFAVVFGMELVGGVLRERYVLGPGRPAVREPPQGMEAELIRAFASYLGVAPPAAGVPAAETAAG